MNKDFKILSTKKLTDDSVEILRNKEIQLFEHNFISTKSILQNTDSELLNTLAQQKLYVIFTSANAVKAVAEKLLFQPKWKVFCISGKTQKTIEQLFTKAEIIDHAPNGEELSEKILAHQDIKHFLFFSGDRRMHTIPDKLTAAGKHLQEIVVYQTELTPVKSDDNYNGILFFSPSGVESFFSENKISKETVLFSLGPSTTKAIKKYSENIIECAFPSEEEMVKSVNNYFKTKTSPPGN